MDRDSARYEEDFFAWTEEQARRLREGSLGALDIANLAEEIEGMGRSVRRELESRIIMLLIHLLKWQVQIGFRSGSWSGTIREQREQIKDLLTQSPSLRSVVETIPPALYTRARRRAASETGLALSTFPLVCPFTPAEVLAQDFLSEGRDHRAAGGGPSQRA